MRVLLDTNVLATGLVGGPLGFPSPPAQIWRHWKAERFRLLVSEHVLEEVMETLELPWFVARLGPPDRERLLEELHTSATMVDVTTVASGIASHSEDDLVLSAAISGNAGYLVTGDTEFLRVKEYQGVLICTPAEFLRELETQSV